jgi:hypothetical protein
MGNFFGPYQVIGGGGSSITSNYASAYFDTTATWSASSTSFIDPTNATSDTLHALKSNGLSISAAGSSKLGITFTPAASTSVYLITANITLIGTIATSDWLAAKLWDGTTIIALASINTDTVAAYAFPTTLNGIFVPGTASAVTVTIQLAAAGGACVCEDTSGIATPAMFSVIQIA